MDHLLSWWGKTLMTFKYNIFNILKDARFSNHCEFNCLPSIIAITTSNHAMYKCQCKFEWTLALYQASHIMNQKCDLSYAYFLFKVEFYLYSTC